MTIKVGDRLPEASFRVMGPQGPAGKSTDEVFKGKKVVLFAVPGAFTPTCSNNHLPGSLENADAFKAKGVDTIAVTGVNDVFVMRRLEEMTGAGAKIEFLADGNGDFAKALELRSTAPAPVSASAPSATPCWSKTAWSRRSTSKNRPARPKPPAPTRC